MNIELMMKAVNELKGCLSNCYNNMHVGDFLFIDKDDGNYVISGSDDGNDVCLSYICKTSQFEGLTRELSHAPWIKGASLAEYQAADKEALKVENKTVEVDGMVYEIGKLYSFKDIDVKDSAIGTLIRVANHNKKFNFLADIDDSQGWFQECKVLDHEIGTITHATVKLVDGAAYMFDYEDEGKVCGFYNKICHRFSCLDFVMNPNNCTNITRLVPEVNNETQISQPTKHP